MTKLNMTIFDVVLIIILAGFVFHGLFFGLIKEIGSFLGIAGGLWAAFYFYIPVYNQFSSLFFGHDSLGKAAVFLIIYIIVNRLITFVFALLDKAFDIISIIPFLKTINRLAGAVLGFFEGGIIIGLVLLAITAYFPNWNFINNQIDFSRISIYLMQLANKIIAWI